MSDGETHYDVLGIEPSASKEQIRSSYQEQLDATQAQLAGERDAKRPDDNAIAGAREREADLRKAWQVLSDPYQRGRYDATIEAGGPIASAGGDVEVLDDGGGADDGAPIDPREARRRARAEAMANRPPGMLSPEPGQTPSTWPAGLHAPPNRARTLALFVDVAVLGLIFIAAQVIGVFAIDEIYPEETKALDRNSDQIDARDRQIDRLDECIDTRPAKPENEPTVCRGADGTVALTKSELESEKKTVERQRDRLDDRRSDLQSDIAPGTFGIVGAVLLASLLYLVPSSVISGRTLGKKLFQIRVVKTDGSKVGLQPAMLRYATPVLLSLLLLSIGLGPLAVVLVLFGVLTWPRNANKQSLPDRLAGTLVVDG